MIMGGMVLFMIVNVLVVCLVVFVNGLDVEVIC